MGNMFIVDFLFFRYVEQKKRSSIGFLASLRNRYLENAEDAKHNPRGASLTLYNEIQPIKTKIAHIRTLLFCARRVSLFDGIPYFASQEIGRSMMMGKGGFDADILIVLDFDMLSIDLRGVASA